MRGCAGIRGASMAKRGTGDIMIECGFLEGGQAAGTPRDGVLGRVIYGDGASSAGLELIDGVPVLRLPIDRAQGRGFTESWRGKADGDCGRSGGLVHAHDGEFLFCAGLIPAAARYADATRAAYLDVFELIARLGFPKIFRIWNFIGDINADNADGLEIYRDFCRGRAEAFEAGYAGRHGMPAATGIGMAGGGAAFYLLACRSADARHIENERQLPAWRYPSRYGPRPPSFARASALLPADGSDAARMLFVSGTASILGHETLHAGDAVAQCRLAIDNIAHLTGGANLARHGLHAAYALHELDCIKVYYRHGRDLPALRAVCGGAFHPDAQLRYIETDICRADLLVEIEALVPAREGTVIG
jgi:FkbO/Hyg5 family chorismatase